MWKEWDLHNWNKITRADSDEVGNIVLLNSVQFFLLVEAAHLLLFETQTSLYSNNQNWDFELQIISGILAHVHFTMDPVITQTHPAVIRPVPECIMGMYSATGKIHRSVS